MSSLGVRTVCSQSAAGQCCRDRVGVLVTSDSRLYLLCAVCVCCMSAYMVL